ncbi:MAG: hypothetical protein JXQ73_31635 [Phycisphaerae bacterium]|nr:hypothetical protein [Phycisphaerae bacterium]
MSTVWRERRLLAMAGWLVLAGVGGRALAGGGSEAVVQGGEAGFWEGQREVHQAIAERRYEDARRILRATLGEVEAGRADGASAEGNEGIRREAEAVDRFISEEQRNDEARQVRKAATVIDRSERARGRGAADREGPRVAASTAAPRDVGDRRRAVGVGPASPRVLGRRMGEVAFDEAPLGEVMARLRDRTGLNFDVRWRALERVDVDRRTPVTVEKLTGLTLGDVLEIVVESVSSEPGQLGFVVHQGRIVVSTKEDLGRIIVTRRYDVKDLLHDAPDFYGTGGGLGGYSGSGSYGGGGRGVAGGTGNTGGRGGSSGRYGRN